MTSPVPLHPSTRALFAREHLARAAELREAAAQGLRDAERQSDPWWRDEFTRAAEEDLQRAAHHEAVARRWMP